MKKVIAILLSVLCVFSCFGSVALAASPSDDFYLIDMKENEEPLLYCLTYQKETLSGVRMMYKPNPSLSLTGPGYVTVTKDTPLAVDHEFVCWKDKNTGKLYYAGDKYYVDGECTLYAVWEEKKDNHIRPVRVFLCAMNTMTRMFEKALGIFKDYKDFEENWIEAKKRAVAAYDEAINAAKASQNVKISVKSGVDLSLSRTNYPDFFDETDALIKNFNRYDETAFEVSGGVTADGKTANDLIRPFGEASNLNDNRVYNGSVEELENGGKKIKIVLLREFSTLEEVKDAHSGAEDHAKFFDLLDLAKPVGGERVTKNAEVNYSKTTIRAVTDSEGKLVSWSVTAPVSVKGTVILNSLFVDVEFDGILRDEYTFTY